MKPTHVLRAIWPVLEPTTPLPDLIAQADLHAIARQAHATITGRPRWAIRPGTDIPGSGGHPLVLIAEAPARPARRRIDAA
jgi:hypothetical protein